MSNYTISPNMNLLLPTVGQDPGPDWATNLNASLSILDQHNHSSGSGVQITPNGLNISSDLSFQGNNATFLRASRYVVQSSPLSGAADLGETYVSGVDLYYNDVNGNQIQLTKNGNIAGTSGSIANLVPPASAAYVSGDATFVFQSGANTPANIDGGSFIFRNITAGSFGLTLSPPTLSSNYTITLPSLPSAISLLTIDTSGNLGTSSASVNATLNSLITTSDVDVGGNLAISGDASVGGTFSAGNTTVSSLISSSDVDVGGNFTVTGDAAINGATLSAGATTLSSLTVNGNLSANGRHVALGQFDPGFSLGIVRGIVSSGGSLTGGEGFSVSGNGSGLYAITYTNAFGDTPSVVANSNGGNLRIADVVSSSNAACQIEFSGGITPFTFIAIGKI